MRHDVHWNMWCTHISRRSWTWFVKTLLKLLRYPFQYFQYWKIFGPDISLLKCKPSWRNLEPVWTRYMIKLKSILDINHNLMILAGIIFVDRIPIFVLEYQKINFSNVEYITERRTCSLLGIWWNQCVQHMKQSCGIWNKLLRVECYTTLVFQLVSRHEEHYIGSCFS